jgi:hypothetical protein
VDAQAGGAVSLRSIPVTLATANDFVRRHHRHHDERLGHRFSIGAVLDGRLVGVAICGRPVARNLPQDIALEVNRNCTDGTRNACSFLYGAAARAAQAMGFYSILTYTLDEEGGASLRALGWWGEPAYDLVKTWHTPSDPRRVGGIPKPKWRWVRFLSEWPEWREPVRRESTAQGSLFAEGPS